MQIQRRLRASKSLGIASALLLSTAIAAPAFAQIEEVVVTAQKKTENIQTVPIAISAFTNQDLKAHQIERFQDLQFSTPNVSYTKGNFTDSDFQIRGIGVTAIGYDSESGVAINFNDVYLANPNLADSGFFDLQRIEVLRGPQSTLYGRGATGGVVSVVGAKPELDSFSSDLEATYGNYDYTEVKGMVNVPIVTDKLGLRIAGDWLRHSGYTTNIYDNSHPDNRSQYALRGTFAGSRPTRPRWT
jgi:outer membrane receptor protein involved in Fe transport